MPIQYLTNVKSGVTAFRITMPFLIKASHIEFMIADHLSWDETYINKDKVTKTQVIRDLKEYISEHGYDGDGSMDPDSLCGFIEEAKELACKLFPKLYEVKP